MQDESAELVACIPRLRRYARALMADFAGADDLVQDTMERAWRRLASWRRGAEMRPWLFGIMHNLHVDGLRKAGLATVALDADTPHPTAAASDPLELRDLHTALQALPPEQREVLLLVALEEMRYEEVAAALAIPLGTVMSRLSRAREKLRAQMEGRVPSPPLKVIK